MARKLTTRRIVIETLIVAGIFVLVHLPIYPPYGKSPQKAAESAGAAKDCPAGESVDATRPAAGAKAAGAPCHAPTRQPTPAN